MDARDKPAQDDLLVVMAGRDPVIHERNMSRISYVNGTYVPHRDAAVHIEDRGYQFADGVYEVICIWNGVPVDYDGHIVRLNRSLRELSMASAMSDYFDAKGLQHGRHGGRN